LCCFNRISTFHISFRVYEKMDNDMWFSSYDSSDDEILEELHDKFMVIYTMRYI
jgi:hypothetical protein